MLKWLVLRLGDRVTVFKWVVHTLGGSLCLDSQGSDYKVLHNVPNSSWLFSMQVIPFSEYDFQLIPLPVASATTLGTHRIQARAHPLRSHVLGT